MSLTTRRALSAGIPQLISLKGSTGVYLGRPLPVFYVPLRTNFTPPRKSPNIRKKRKLNYFDIPRIPGVTCAVDNDSGLHYMDNNHQEFILGAPLESQPSVNDIRQNGVITEFVNRNPRNLEMMNLARKRSGWWLEADRKDYHYRINFDKNARHTTGSILHSSGRTVVSASTAEYGISKYLYRNTDLSAAENIGKVLGRRMLETGIVFALCYFTKEERQGTRVAVFLNGLTDLGIQLQEKSRIVATNPFGEKSNRLF